MDALKSGGLGMPADASTWLDLRGLGQLHADAGRTDGRDPATLRAVAQQFESLFLAMMLKSMRDASPVDSPFDSDTTRFYQDLLDKQLSTSMPGARGLGIADVLVRQLGGEEAGAPSNERAGSGPGVGFDPSLRALPPAVSAALARAQAVAASGFGDEGGLPELPPMLPAGFVPEIPAPAARFAAPVTLPPEVDASRTPFADSPEAFVRKVLPLARRAAEALGVHPHGIVAQAALETGWGRSVPASADGAGHNLFGIKATDSWNGRRHFRETLEYAGGGPAAVPERRREAFRAYGSLESAFADYVGLLSRSPRYANALAEGADPVRFARALQSAGYATDPAYARKIESILGGETLREALAAAETGLKNEAAPPIP